jgi:aspartyl-tRNA(Asn)/glutamyl-tRNA(Gln) amidotransferase subunit A
MLFSFTSIKDYHAFLWADPDGCKRAVTHYLAKIKQSRPLNAFVEVFDLEALERAAFLDQKRKSTRALGSLHGVVVSLKDVISYRGHKLSAGSRILQNYTSIYHATAVQKLLEADAIIIGRNNCDEFAMGSSNENSAYGNVHNALDPERVPGGSSGGSAVAVQAGLCMVSLGSDTGGSVRQPADFCGVVGLKPTYGRVSRYGLIAYASSFDQIGVFGRSVPDVGLVLEVISGADDHDATSSKKPVPEGLGDLGEEKEKKSKIAVFSQALFHQGLDPEIKATFEAFLEKLSIAGHQVELIDFEYLDYIVPAYYVLTTAEASSNLSRFDAVKYGSREKIKTADLTDFYKINRSAGFGKEVKRRILLGTFVLSAGYYEAYFSRAQQVRRLLVERTDLIFNQFDFILSPTAPSTAFKIGEKMEDPISMYLADIYTVYANLTGIPAISIPLFSHTNGMPFGVQAMTSRFKELSLLRFSNNLMQQYKSYENPTL